MNILSKDQIHLIAFSILSLFPFFMEKTSPFLLVFLLISFYVTYRGVEHYLRSRSFCGGAALIILVTLLALFAVIGDISAEGLEHPEISYSCEFWVKKVFLFGGWYTLLFYPVAALMCAIDSQDFCCISQRNIAEKYPSFSLKKYPFRTCFISLLLIYFPLAVISYPALLIEFSSYNVILPAFPGCEQFLPHRGISFSLHNHHPIAYTMLLHGFICAGRDAFHSANVGLFAAIVMQVIIVASSVALAAKILVERVGVRFSLVMGAVILAAANPLFIAYLFTPTKDILYSAFFLFFLSFSYLSISDNQERADARSFPRYLLWFGIVVASIGVILFRSEGSYLCVPSLMALLLLCRSKRVFFLSCLLVVVATHLGRQAAMEHYNVLPGKSREMFSVPFQQTALCLKSYPEDVTADEQAELAAVCPHTEIAELYDPQISDPVKARFVSLNATEEKTTYLRAWYTMGKRHPFTYIKAFFLNHFLTFAPLKSTGQCWVENFAGTERAFGVINARLAAHGCHFELPHQLHEIRHLYEKVRRKVINTPFGIVWVSPAVATWVVCLMLAYASRHRCLTAFVFTLPVCLIICANLLGPCNATNVRYSLPLYLALPFYFAYCLSLIHQMQRHE